MGVAGLLFQPIECDASSVHPSWGACLEAVQLESQGHKRLGEALGGLLPGPAGAHRLVAHPDLPAQEGAGCEDDGRCAIGAAEVGAHPRDPASLVRGALHLKSGHHCFAQGHIWRVLQQLQHLAGVLAFVRLGAQGPNGWPPAAVEHSFLEGCGVRQPSDHSTEGIHLVD